MDGDEAKSSSTNGKQERLEVVDDDGESESTISETEGQINHEFNGGIKCENCPAYQANAHKAWTILADYGKAQRQIKELETRCDQLERIGQEARDYNDTLRINDEALNETIKARDMEIRNWQEKYADIENQYAKVLKAGMEAKKSTDEFNALRKKFEEVEQECSDFKKKLKEALASKDELQRKFKAACLMLSKSKKSPGQSHHFNLDTVFESRFLMEMKKMPLLLDDIDLIFGPPPIPEIAPQIEIFEENEVSIQELQEMEVEEQTIPEPTKEPPTIQKPQTEENVASASIPTQIDEEEPEEEAPNLQIDEEEEKEEDEPTIHEEKVASTSPNELQLEEEPTIPNSQIESQPEKEAPNLQIDEEPEEEAPNLQIDEEPEEAEDEPTIQRAQNEEKVTTSTPIPNRQTSPEDEDEEPMIIIERFETEEEQEEVPTTIKNRQIDNSPEPMNEDEPTTSTSNVVQKRTTNIQSSPEPEDEEEGPTIQQNRRIEEKAAEAASSIPKLQIDPSQIDWKRPKDLAINDIRKKYRIDKDEATLVYCEALREQRKQWFGGKRKRISSDEDGQDSDGDYGLGGSKKIRSEPAAMPWVPKNHLLPLNARPSILTFDEHKRYVAIISNELKADATYRHGENKLELKSLDKKLEEERKYYVETALKKAKNIKDAFGCPYWTVNLFKDLQRMKVQLYIGDRAFQGVVHSIPWPTTNRTTTRALNLRIVNVLSQGSAKIASIPDIKKKYEMRVDKLSKAMKWQYNNKEPIIEDQQIQDFGLANNVPLLMDASTFRHLLCSAWSHRLQSYACRLTVMRRVHSAQMKSIIIISPPIIASQLYKTTVAQSFVKWALKTNILREKQQPKTSTSTSSPPKKARKDENDGDGDYLSLLEEMGLGFIGASNKSDQCGKGKRYAIVSLGDLKKEEAMADDEQKYRVLVRTACRLLEKNTPEEKHISTTAHAEFLPEVGAEKLTDEEMLWNVVTGMLHGSEEHLNFRINVSRVAAEKPNVLQIDRRQSTNLQKIPNEIRQLLSARIQRFCALLDAVSELAVGEYILMPDSKNGALQIVKEKTDFNMEDDEMDGACYDSDWFKDLLNKKGRPVPSNEIERYWNGIDPHYPLQYQIVRTQIPGALRPQTKKK